MASHAVKPLPPRGSCFTSKNTYPWVMCRADKFIKVPSLPKSALAYFDFKYSTIVPASLTSKGSGSESWMKLGSMKSFSTLQSLITAEYLQLRSPKPRFFVHVQLMPMPRVKRAAPSGNSLTCDFCCRCRRWSWL